MAQQLVDIGIQGNDGTGDSIRTSFDKVNQNFTEIYAIFGGGGTIGFGNLSDAPVINSFTITGASGNGTTATITFTNPDVAARAINPAHNIGTPFVVGQNIVISGVTPSGYNGSHIVTATNTGSVSFASATTGSVTAGSTPGAVRTTAQYSPSQVIMAGTTGGTLTARNVRGTGGITIDTTSNYDLVISSANAGLIGDTKPALGASINANNSFSIGNLADPSQNLVTAFNALWPGNPTDFDHLAINVGYANRSYVRISNGVVVGPLKPREEPDLPQIGNVDYDPTLSGNFLSSETVSRKNLVLRTGDTMTGALTLNDHPAPMSGQGAANGADDLQAATKFYVDNSTYYSGTNLYVSTKGDDLQTKSPLGREGRAWQYAYRSVGAACLAAENLIRLSTTEPGPYRQTIAYTVGPTQYKSTVQSVVLSGGNSGVTGYENVASLMRSNKQFIQYETIAYLNKKYVNDFIFDNATYTAIIGDIVIGVGYDLVLSSTDGTSLTTYNSTTEASKLYNTYNSSIITNQLTQIIDGINFARDQILDYAYSTPNTQTYIGTVISALADDLALGTNYKSLQVGLAFDSASTGLSDAEIVDLLDDSSITVTSLVNTGSIITLNFAIQDTLPYVVGSSIIVENMVPSGYDGTFTVIAVTNQSVTYTSSFVSTLVTGGSIVKNNVIQNILNANGVPTSPTAVASLTTNTKLIRDIISIGLNPSPIFGSLSTTSIGQASAQLLLLENIDFIQAEIVAYLLANYPNLSYNKSKYQQDIKYIVYSLIYDFMYGGNTQSIYTANRYWINNVLQISANEQAPTADFISYIGTLANKIVINTAPVKIYQTTVTQYTNETYSGGVAVASSITANINVIKNIVNNTARNPSVVAQTFGNASVILTTARTNVLALSSSMQTLAVTFTNLNSPVLNNATINSTISNLFKVITNLLIYGISTRSVPTYNTPAGLALGYQHAQAAIIANLNFVADEAIAWMNINFPSVTGINAKSKQDLKYLMEAVVYDLGYGGTSGNSASVRAAQLYWYNGITTILGLNGSTQAIGAAINYAQSIIVQVAQNTTVSPVYSATAQVKNGIWADGSVASTRINTLFATIKDIVANNTATTAVYPVTSSYDSSLITSRNVIVDNSFAITTATVNYLTTTYTGSFAYNEATCFRDLGYIIDGQIIDILTGGNYQSVNAGKSYYRNASARSIAIGTQLTETLDGINFARDLVRQVLTNTTRSRFQSVYTQTIDLTKTLNDSGINSGSDSAAVATFKANYKIITDIISQGYGVAPTATYGTGIYTVTFNNGGLGYVDQGGKITVGETSGIDIIPGKILLGNTSNAYGQIVSYTSGFDLGQANDAITLRLTQPGFFTVGETLDFGETVSALNITIYVESGTYFEDYPIRLPANCTISGDDFRRTIMRPLNRVSQSPWRNIFFYRDAVIDGIQTGKINFGTNYASETTAASATISAISGSMTVTLGNNVQALQSWIGKIFMDAASETGTAGKAYIDSVSSNVLNCTVIYPFAARTTYTSSNWYIWGTDNYGRHYLTNPLLPESDSNPAKNNKDIDVFLVNDATRIKLFGAQGHGGFMMVLDPEGQIKTKSPYAQESACFSGSLGSAKRFAGGQYIDGFAGRLFGTVTNIANGGKTVTVTGGVFSGLDIRPPQTPCAFYVSGFRYQLNDVVSWTQVVDGSGNVTGGTVILTLDNSTPFNLTGAYNTNTSIFSNLLGYVIESTNLDMVIGSNYRTARAGLTYLQPANVVNALGKLLVLQGINNAKTSINALSISSGDKTKMSTNLSLVNSIITNGISALPILSYPGIDDGSNKGKAATIIRANRTFIQSEIAAWISSNYNTQTISGYSSAKSQRDTGYAVDAITYDLLYSGNSAVWDHALSFYYSSSTVGSSFTGSISGTTLTVTLLSTGALAVGQIITGVGVVSNTVIKSQDSGTAGGVGTYTVSFTQTVGSQAMTAAATNSYTTQNIVCAAAMGRLNTVLQQVITNTTVTASAGNELTQNTSLPAATATEQVRMTELVSIIVDYLCDGLMDNDVVVSLTNGSQTLLATNNPSLVVGATIVGAGIQSATTISSITIGTGSNGTALGYSSVIMNKTATSTTTNTFATLSGTGTSAISRTLPTISSYTGFSNGDYTTINNAVPTIKTNTISYLNSGAGIGINIEMGGNKSMLANDFTQVNDLGYGILVANAGLTEQVSTFTYYCHTGYWAKSGGQLRSIAGSNSNGNYGLRATGFDVTELPDSTNLQSNMMQSAIVYKQGQFSSAMTPTATQQALKVYIIGWEYIPQNKSELEIDHTASGGGIVRYEVSTVTHTVVTINGQNVLELQLSTAGNNGTSTTGLNYALYDGQIITIRILQNFKFVNIDQVNPVRPSTALQFSENLGDIYRIIAYNLIESTGEPFANGSGISILGTDSSFNYYKIITDISSIAKGDPISTASAVVAFGGAGNATNSVTLTIRGVTGTIAVGHIVGGIGFTTQTVSAVTTNTATFTGVISGSTLTVSSLTGTITVGMGITGGTTAAGTYIVAQLTGSTGLAGTYTISPGSQTVSSVSMSGTTQTVTLNAFPTTLPVGPVTFSLRSQGSKVGDTKIGIVEIANTSTTNQLNKGIFVTAWNGRTHRIVSYTAPVTASVGTYDASSSGTNLKVTSVAGTIAVGQLVQGTGFDGTQYVSTIVTSVTNGTQVDVTVTLTKAPMSSPSGQLTFGITANPYLTIDANPVYNNSAIGTSVNGMTYVGQEPLPGSTSAKIVTYKIPYNATSVTSNYSVFPPVDSTLTLANNSVTSYNGSYQVTGIINSTQITVASTSALTVGMVVSSATAGTIIPNGTIIQSIDSPTTFTVSPSCWVPSGATVSAITVATLASLSPSVSIGSGYTFGAAPTVSIVTLQGQTAPVRQAVATASVNVDGTINISIVDPGYGYSATPGVTVTGGSGTCPAITATLSNAPSTSATTSGGISTTTMKVLYPTDPGKTGTATATTNATATLSTSSIAVTTGVLTVGTVSGTIAVGMVLSGAGVAQYQAIVITGVSGNGTTATISYASQSVVPFIVGQLITISGVGTEGYNGTYTVASASTTQVTYANTTTGSTNFVSGVGTVSSRVYTYITANLSGSGAGSTWQTATTDGVNRAVASGTITATNNIITVSSTSGLAVGGQVSFTGSALLGGVTATTTSNNVTTTTIYYITHITGNFIGISASAYGSPLTLISASGSMNFYSPAFGYGESIGISNTPTKSGSGPYLVTFTLSKSITITNGAYYQVSGNNNPLYNGFWATTSSTGSGTTLILSYQYDPGTWSGVAATFISREPTTGSSTSLGLSKPFPTGGSVTLRGGYPAGSLAQITVRISTCRATGHDFLDIGTGGFSTTNYPNQIYGNASIAANASRQVVEETVGRVFYVSTDENGIFNVGRFFKVDQGTGTVTFAASIALSNLDGLGFKRGVVVSSFSTDSTMTENAPDVVPVQSAVRGFVDLRLGLDYGGNPVAANTLIGPGFLPLNGALAMKSNLNLGTNYINNLYMQTGVTSPFDGANRAYVDNSVAGTNSLSKLKDTGIGAVGTYVSLSGPTLTVTGVFGTLLIGQTVSSSGVFFTGQRISSFTTSGGNYVITLDGSPGTTPTASLAITFTSLVDGNSLIYDATQGLWKNITLPTGDVNITYNRNNDAISGTLTTAIQADKITNTMVNSAAAIVQSKLSMTAASTRANSTGIVQADRGLASFDSAYFTAASGWISLASSSSISTGIGYNKLRYVSANSILGNLTASASTIQELTAGDVVTAGDGVKNALFADSGALTLAYTAPSTRAYSVTNITTASAANSLIKSASDKSVTVEILKVKGYTTLSLNDNGVTLQLSTPGGAGAATPVYFMTAVGDTTSNTVITTTGTLDTTLGTVKATAITTGATATQGTLVGDWRLQSGSVIDASLGTLKSINLTTGAAAIGGSLTGQWALAANSRINAVNGILQSTTLTAGATTTAGTITGAWSIDGALTLSSASNLTIGSGTLDITGGTLKTIKLNTGASGTAGTVQGAWTIDTGSTFVATTIQNQANSATITASASNNSSEIVRRDSSGNFSAGTITATLSGNATSANSCSGNAATITGQANSATTTATVAATADRILLRNASGQGQLVSLYTNALVAGADAAGTAATTATIQGAWSLTSGSSLQATYADLAEYYEGDREYEVGTVLVFGGDKEVTTTDAINDTRVAGVVSNTAAYSMNSECAGEKNLIALQGRVPVKVVGRVKKGDMLTTAATPGYAVKALNPTLGSIIGKALEDKDTGEAGVIEVAIGRM
jgi:hypothetical protein